MRAEAAAGVGHEVAHELAQAHARGRHDDARQHRRDARPDAQEGPVDRPEERPRATRELAEAAERPRGDVHVLGTRDVVDEPDRELEARGVGDERAEPLGGPAGARVARPLARGEPAAGQRDGLLDEVVRGGEARVADGSGGGERPGGRVVAHPSRVPRVAVARLVRSGAT